MPVAIAHLEARADAVDVVASTLIDFVAQTQREPGALTYVVHRDPAQPTRFVVYERYINAAALADHMAAPWLRSALAGLAASLTAPPTIEWLDDLHAYQRGERPQ